MKLLENMNGRRTKGFYMTLLVVVIAMIGKYEFKMPVVYLISFIYAIYALSITVNDLKEAFTLWLNSKKG